MNVQDDPAALEILLCRVREKRSHIKNYAHKTAPRGAFLTNLSIVSSTVASFLTAAPAIGGIRLTDALGSAGVNSPSWRILCAAATGFSLVAAVATNLFRSHEIAARLAKAQGCDAKLEAIALGAELKQLSLKDATVRYEQCIADVAFMPPYPPIPSFWEQWFRIHRLDRVAGKINLANGSDVPTSCTISGTASGLQPGLYLWLVVEVNGAMWPKEGEVVVKEDGTWTKTIFEEGNAEEFSLSLYVLDPAADRGLRNWFKEGDRTGHYDELHRSKGMLRVTRVDGLHRVVSQRAARP